MRLIDTLIASLIANAVGIFVMLLLTQVIRAATDADWLPAIHGIEAAGLVMLTAAIKTLFDVANEVAYIPPRHPWDRH